MNLILFTHLFVIEYLIPSNQSTISKQTSVKTLTVVVSFLTLAARAVVSLSCSDEAIYGVQPAFTTAPQRTAADEAVRSNAPLHRREQRSFAPCLRSRSAITNRPRAGRCKRLLGRLPLVC